MKPSRAVSRADVEVFDMQVGGETLVVVSVLVGAPIDELLTPAESSVARDAAAGKTNAEIARARCRSPRTIANQLASVYAKLGVGSRVELAALVLRDRR